MPLVSPMIETSRLLLRAWHPGDLAVVSQILGDPDVMQFSDRGVLSESGQAEWLKRAITKKTGDDLPGLCAVERKSDRSVIGYVSLSGNFGRVQRGDAEIGFRLAKTAWGRGYATEAVGGMIGALSNFEPVDRLIAIVDPHNHRSIHVLKKVGMSYHSDLMFEGYDYPDHLYIRRLF